MAPIDGGEPWSSQPKEAGLIFDVVSFPVVWLPGELLFVAGTTIGGMNLYGARISAEGITSGPIRSLTTGPGMTWMPSVSSNDRIALARFSWVVHLWEVALDTGTGQPMGGPRRITDDASPKFSFSLTRDGDRLVYSTFAGSRAKPRNDIVLKDRLTGETRVPVSVAVVTTSLFPRLDDEGSLLSWRSWDNRESVAYVAPLDDPIGRELCRNCTVVDFFSDGEYALVDWGRSLSRVRITDGSKTPILKLEDGRALIDTDLSRDDRWLAIQVGEPNGNVAIFAVPLGESAGTLDEWIEIAADSFWNGSPRWSTDGNTLYFLSERDDSLCVWGQALDPDTKVPNGEPFVVAHGHGSAMMRMSFAKHMWNLDVGGDRLVFNAGEFTGDVYTAMLDTE